MHFSLRTCEGLLSDIPTSLYQSIEYKNRHLFLCNLVQPTFTTHIYFFFILSRKKHYGANPQMGRPHGSIVPYAATTALSDLVTVSLLGDTISVSGGRHRSSSEIGKDAVFMPSVVCFLCSPISIDIVYRKDAAQNTHSARERLAHRTYNSYSMYNVPLFSFIKDQLPRDFSQPKTKGHLTASIPILRTSEHFMDTLFVFVFCHKRG